MSEEKKKKRGFIRSTLFDLWHRFTPVKETKDKEKYYYNGENNLYPYEVEATIKNSPTAKRASNIMKKFIAGKGIVGSNPIVNSDTGDTLTKVVERIAKDVSVQYGCFIHVSFGADLKPKELTILDYVECRIAKEDDDDNEGKIFVKDWICALKDRGSSVGRNKEKKEAWYYPFNNNEDVIKAQIKADAGINKDIHDFDIIEALPDYRGQVYYLNLTPEREYAESLIDSVYLDAESEAYFSIYTNTQFANGFLGKTVAVTSGLDDEQSEKVSNDLKLFLGSKNSGAIYHLDVTASDDITKIIHFIQLKPQFDDKLFSETEKRVRRNILGAFNNVPPALVDASDSALFGTSGEAYAEMKEFYSEQTESERNSIEEALTYIGFPCKIIPIVEPKTEKPKTENNEVVTD